MSTYRPLERTIAHRPASPPPPSNERKPRLLNRIKNLFRKRRRSPTQTATSTPPRRRSPADYIHGADSEHRTPFEASRAPRPVFHRGPDQGLPRNMIEDPPAPAYHENEAEPPRYEAPRRSASPLGEQPTVRDLLSYAFVMERPVFGSAFRVTARAAGVGGYEVEDRTFDEDTWRWR